MENVQLLRLGAPPWRLERDARGMAVIPAASVEDPHSSWMVGSPASRFLVGVIGHSKAEFSPRKPVWTVLHVPCHQEASSGFGALSTGTR